MSAPGISDSFPTAPAAFIVRPSKSQPTPRAKWYSPQLRRDLVKRLYFRAKAEGIPMTRLADRLIEEALARPAVVQGEFTARVAEEPHSTAPVPG